MNNPGCVIAWAQKEMSREVSLMLIPTFALNHWRSSSTSVIRATGASQMRAASSVKSSKISSGMVSSTEYCQRTLRRCFSFFGTGAVMRLFQVPSAQGYMLTSARQRWKIRNPKFERRLQKSHLSGIRMLCSPSPLPTPALSLRERENQGPRCDHSKTARVVECATDDTPSP